MTKTTFKFNYEVTGTRGSFSVDTYTEDAAMEIAKIMVRDEVGFVPKTLKLYEAVKWNN